MRLVADLVRGKEVFRALGILKFSNKEAAARVEKLLRSAIANWEAKTSAKPKTANSISAQSSWIAPRCSNASAPHLRAAATASANVPTT